MSAGDDGVAEGPGAPGEPPRAEGGSGANEPRPRIPESLRGLHALVTGSATGIGRHIALALARQGVHVAFNYKKSRAAAVTAADEARALGVKAAALCADCADPRQARGVVEEAAIALGGLEILVNNVGEFAWKLLREQPCPRQSFAGAADGWYTLHPCARAPWPDAAGPRDITNAYPQPGRRHLRRRGAPRPTP